MASLADRAAHVGRAMACLATLSALAAAPAPGAIHIGGNVAPPGDWTIEKLRSTFENSMNPIDDKTRDGKHAFGCVALTELLKAAGVPTDFKTQPGADPKQKHKQLRDVVTIVGADGYTVVFSLGELMPAIGGKKAWLALDEDGQPLKEEDAPARLLVPDDKIPARAVRQVAEIDVIQLDGPTTRP
jgi:hypothetical protein